MKRLLLLSLLAVGCAHAPRLESVRSETVYAADIGAAVRAAVHDELLAAAVTRPGYDGMMAAINGQPTYLGTIDFTAVSKTNAQATTPFGNSTATGTLCGRVLLLSPSTAVYLGKGAASTDTVTAAQGVPVQPNERVIWMMPGGQGCYLAALRQTADGNLKVWALDRSN